MPCKTGDVRTYLTLIVLSFFLLDSNVALLPRPVQLTTDLFSGICGGEPAPKDVYLAATVGGRSGGGSGGDGGFRRALTSAGVPVLVCSSYRLHSAVACSLGGDSGIGGGNTSEACSNGKMRRVVRKAVSMVERFERWRPAGGAYAAAAAHAACPATLATVRVEVEELGVALARTRSSNARRVAEGKTREGKKFVACMDGWGYRNSLRVCRYTMAGFLVWREFLR